MKAKRIVYAALMIAFGVLLPQVFHMVGGPGLGGVLLPMHIPVLIAGFIFNPITALIVGILTPIFSFIYTGGSMPAVPMIYFMILELGVYGLAISIIFKRYKNIFVGLIGGMLLGRVARGLAYIFATKVLGFALPPAFGIVAAITQGMPGIVIQLVIIPPIITIMKKKGWIITNDDERRVKEFS